MAPLHRVTLLALPDDVLEHWAQGVCDLLVMPPHPAWTDEGWTTLQQDARQFLREWAPQAYRLGWDGLDLFGVHRGRPTARVDCLGLVPLLRGRAVLALTEDSAAIKTASGRSLTFRRRPTPPAEQRLIWELGC